MIVGKFLIGGFVCFYYEVDFWILVELIDNNLFGIIDDEFIIVEYDGNVF